MDNHENFAFSLIDVAPSPADTGTSLAVQAGTGTRFPTAPFNATVAPDGVLPLLDNSEIVRVTAKSGDVFTILREQEGTTAKIIAPGWRIANTITKKVITDIEAAISTLESGVLYYVHDQISASSTWVINHDLNAFPNVTVVDSGGTAVEGSVVYNDSNTITITFTVTFGGKAFLT